MREDLERLAREAGISHMPDGIRDNGEASDYWDCWPEQLERFAQLVREDCAARCEAVGNQYQAAGMSVARECAAAIRNSASCGAEG